MNYEALKDICFNLPKVELHAHLNGSLSESTVKKLISISPYKIPSESTVVKKGTEIEKAFEAFGHLHKLTDTLEAIKIAITGVIQDFAKDKVVYLELRTTPRTVEGNYTPREYVDCISDVIKFCNSDPALTIKTKLLLSVDRRFTFQKAEEIVKLAREWRNRGDGVVVGLDISGDPKANSLKDLVPLMQQARSDGLKLAVHMSEVPGFDDETEMVLNTCVPDRIGHGTYLSQQAQKIIREKKIPIELCLTSNVSSGTVISYEDHHIKNWYDWDHPLIICTDDKGVFDTSLSEEYIHAAKILDLNSEKLRELSRQALKYSFAEENEKLTIFQAWDKYY